MPTPGAAPRRAKGGLWGYRPANHTALVSRDREFTVGDMQRRATSARAALEGLDTHAAPGFRPRVLLPSSDSAAFVAGLLACIDAGVVAIPFRDETRRIEDISATTRPTGVLRCDEDVPRVEVLEAERPRADTPDRGDLLVLTSGSTGSPKAVALDFAHVLFNAAAAGTALRIWQCDRWAIDMDLSLMSALGHLAMAWLFDLPLVHLDAAADGREEHWLGDGTAGFGTSPIGLLRLASKVGQACSPVMAVSSGDFLTEPMVAHVASIWPGTRISKFYGLTEVGGRFCCLPHEELGARVETVGRPLPGFAVDMDGDGLLHARAPTLANGYYHASGDFEPFETDWLSTGDVGSVDEQGFVTLYGRADDVFKVGGEKVDRHTVEAALKDLLPNREYCVLAVHHALFGDVPALFIGSSVAGSEAPVPNMATIVRHLRPRLDSRFVPPRAFLVDEGLPRLGSGKIDRVRLRKLATEIAPLP